MYESGVKKPLLPRAECFMAITQLGNLKYDADYCACHVGKVCQEVEDGDDGDRDDDVHDHVPLQGLLVFVSWISSNV
jgi:hypothetical protein